MRMNMGSKVGLIWQEKIKTADFLGTPEITISGMGNPALLESLLIGIFTSVKCPARLILKAQEEAKEFSARNQAVISGFQSPVEKEMLEVLLRGASPIIICPARGLAGMRIPVAWRQKIEQGQLLVISPFPAYIKRSTPETVDARNYLVARLASELLIVHAEPGGKVEMVLKVAESAGKLICRL
jgi:predicted Rossmann fold nucleotide-binding protein DprA/Smf involved in DNA uptake